MRFVVLNFKVVNTKVFDFLHFSLDHNFGELFRLPLELPPQRLHVVQVDVRVAERVHEVPGHEVAHVRDHHREQSVARDVEGDAEAHVRRALEILHLLDFCLLMTELWCKTHFSKSPVLAHLVELAGEFPGGHVELDEAVAGRQRHLVQVRGVPGAHDDPPVAGPGLDPVDNLSQLVHTLQMKNILIAIKII